MWGGGALGKCEDWLLRKADASIGLLGGSSAGLTPQRHYMNLGDLVTSNTVQQA